MVLHLQSALVLFLLVCSSDLVRLAWGKFDLWMIFSKRSHGLTFSLVFDMRDISDMQKHATALCAS
jgi:hypothetical protein